MLFNTRFNFFSQAENIDFANLLTGTIANITKNVNKLHCHFIITTHYSVHTSIPHHIITYRINNHGLLLKMDISSHTFLIRVILDTIHSDQLGTRVCCHLLLIHTTIQLGITPSHCLSSATAQAVIYKHEIHCVIHILYIVTNIYYKHGISRSIHTSHGPH